MVSMVRRSAMKITVDPQACNNARECRQCLDRCPEKVFGTYPRVRRARGVAAGDWTVTPVFASQCTGCLECLNFCPSHAISLQ